MYRNILTSTDGSELALTGVRAAAELAKALGAKLTVITVTMPFHIVSYDPVMVSDTEPRYREDMSKLAARHLLEAEEAARGCGVEPALLHEEEENPADAIVRVAAERGCDLIVMSSHGRTGFAGLLIGSETRKVLAMSNVPVLVCRPRPAGQEGAA